MRRCAAPRHTEGRSSYTKLKALLSNYLISYKFLRIFSWIEKSAGQIIRDLKQLLLFFDWCCVPRCTVDVGPSNCRMKNFPGGLQHCSSPFQLKILQSGGFLNFPYSSTEKSKIKEWSFHVNIFNVKLVGFSGLWPMCLVVDSARGIDHGGGGTLGGTPPQNWTNFFSRVWGHDSCFFPFFFILEDLWTGIRARCCFFYKSFGDLGKGEGGWSGSTRHPFPVMRGFFWRRCLLSVLFLCQKLLWVGVEPPPHTSLASGAWMCR